MAVERLDGENGGKNLLIDIVCIHAAAYDRPRTSIAASCARGSIANVH